MTNPEIEIDVANKVKILKWLVENKLRDIHQIGNIMGKYYTGKIKV
jgi:hypothetical protein